MPGVLFAEDFDEEPCLAEPPPSNIGTDIGTTSVASEDLPRHSDAELRDATAIARDDGFRAGRLAALDGIEAKRLVAIEQGLTSLGNARAAALAAVEDGCGRVAATTLTLLLGFLPCIAGRFAAEGIRSILLGLVESLVEADTITIAVHPDLLGDAEHTLAASRAGGVAVALVAEPAMARGDLSARWRNGRAKRDVAALKRQMQAALAEAGLLDSEIAETEGDERDGQ